MDLSTQSARSRTDMEHSVTTHENVELPHTQTGEVDWNTLGNILTAHILGEVICASYVDPHYGVKKEKDFKPDTDWKFEYREHQISVLCKKFKDSPIKTFMGRGVIDVPMEDAVAYISTNETRTQWDQTCVEIATIVSLGETDEILYMHSRAAHCLVRAERDFCTFYRKSYVDGKFVQTTMSVEYPDCQRDPNIVRAQTLPGSGFVIEPYQGSSSRTLISYLGHVDLVTLPPIISNWAVRRQATSIRYIKEILNPRSTKVALQQRSFNSSIPRGHIHSRESPHPFSTSGCHYEDSVPFHAFTRVSRHSSIPEKPDQIKPGGSRPKQSSNLTSLSPLATSAGLPSNLSLASPPNGTVATAPKLDIQRQQSLEEQANGVSPSHPLVGIELARPNLVSALSATPEDGMIEEREEKEEEGDGENEEEEEGKVEEESREEGHVAVQITNNSSSPNKEGHGSPALISSERRDGLKAVPSSSQDSQRNTASAMPLDVTATKCNSAEKSPISSANILTNERSQSSSSGDSFHTAVVGLYYDEDAAHVTAESTGFDHNLADTHLLTPTASLSSQLLQTEHSTGFTHNLVYKHLLTPTASLSSQLLQAERPQDINPRPESQMFHSIISM